MKVRSSIISHEWHSSHSTAMLGRSTSGPDFSLSRRLYARPGPQTASAGEASW